MTEAKNGRVVPAKGPISGRKKGWPYNQKRKEEIETRFM